MSAFHPQGPFADQSHRCSLLIPNCTPFPSLPFPSPLGSDIFQDGNWDQYLGYQYQSALPGYHRMVVDPCGHCQAAASQFPHDTVFGRVLLPILMGFDMMSNDDPQNKTWPPVPEGVSNITMYVMGDDENGAAGNYWTTVPELPAPTPTKLFLAAGGKLAAQAGTAKGSSTYTYDPADPVKTIGGDNLLIPCGPLDQRPNEELNRQDLLLFTGEPLAESLAIAGAVSATIFLSTNVVDTDVVVKLIDVYPSNSSNKGEAGASILVLDGIARARWRGFPESNDPQPLSGSPSDVYELEINLWRTAYVFGAGHSVRLHVTSSNYNRFASTCREAPRSAGSGAMRHPRRPHFPTDLTNSSPLSNISPQWPTPNTGVWMNETQGSKNVTATTSIRFGAGQASAVTLPVVPLSALPEFPVEEAVTSMLARHEAKFEANVRRREATDVNFRTWLERRLRKAWDVIARGAGSR